jgi:UDP-N-acetyl-D-glucosamine/UDP-N-acetyl-D-galactosamine dehydrogenase
MKTEQIKIAVIGLGYVGLPLAVAFARKYQVVGFDINPVRINELRACIDVTKELESNDLQEVIHSNSSSAGLIVSDKLEDLNDCNFYIVTVPTPVDKYNHPDLTPLYKASQTVGKVLKRGDIVVYESTVYPGVTEDECVPVLENVSGLKYNIDFFAGYSPERINPGDKEHTVTKILKVTSGSTPEIAEKIDNLYSSVITAGTFKASSIKVAEAAKVIENSQRDINIAFVNELSKIFNLLGIDTNDVLEAAGTKWNFLKFKPGLVGGHCIGVDPYYLAQKAQQVGYHPEIILAGRRLNDGMGQHVASEVIKLMVKKDIRVKSSKIILLGFTFKENCPDIRNTKVVDIYRELLTYGAEVTIYDPLASNDEAEHEYGIKITSLNDVTSKKFDAAILCVAHSNFNFEFVESLVKPQAVIYDVKGVLPATKIDARL